MSDARKDFMKATARTVWMVVIAAITYGLAVSGVLMWGAAQVVIAGAAYDVVRYVAWDAPRYVKAVKDSTDKETEATDGVSRPDESPTMVDETYREDTKRLADNGLP